MIEGLGQLGLKHVAWVVARLVLQKLSWEMSPSVQVCLTFEVPREVLQDEEFADFVEMDLVRLEELVFEVQLIV